MKGGGILYQDGRKVVEEWWEKKLPIPFEVVNKECKARIVELGNAGVAAMPTDSAFNDAAVYTFDNSLLEVKKANAEDLFIRINYRGDVCRVYADGQLVEDNFWNGKGFYVRVADIKGKKVEIKILPLTKTDLIYLQQEQRDELAAVDKYLISLDGIELIQRCTK